MTDQEIENEIKAKGADVAPRVTLEDIEGAIVSECYFTARQGELGAIADPRARASGTTAVVLCEGQDNVFDRLTFCILVLRNGFTVTGESACVSSANFDADLGRKIARQNAIDKCWPLFGFALADRLAREAA